MKYNFSGVYINLDSCIDRRIFIEHQLRNNGVLDIYERCQGYEACEITNKSNYLKNSELACKMSHMKAIKSAKENTHIHIIEDDIKFVPNHFEILNKTLEVLGDDWDILYTGVLMPLIKKQIISLINLLEEKSSLNILDMKNLLFVGGFSYVVNKNSTNKVLDILQSCEDLPFDLILRHCIYQKENLKAKLIFPMIAIHEGDFETTMQDRKAELTYEFQYLFQKAFIANNDLNLIMSEIIDYASKCGVEIKDTKADMKNIYTQLFALADIIKRKSKQ